MKQRPSGFVKQSINLWVYCGLIAIGCLFIRPIPSMAQADEAAVVPIFFARTDAGITFYGLDGQNNLSEMGRLPENFDLSAYWSGARSDSDSERRWLANWWNMNVVLSPDGSRIAFTADTPTAQQDAIDFYLYLYDPQSNDLQQAYTVRWNGVPRSDLRWSPDSRAILIEPVYGESSAMTPYAEPFVYDIESGQATTLTDTNFGKVWGGDNRSLLNIAGYDTPVFTLIDPIDDLRREIGSAADLVHESVEWVSPLCDFAWSPEARRWYFVAQCGTAFTPAERVYSVMPDGTLHLEIDFPAYFRQEIGLDDNQANISLVDLQNLYVANGAVYVALTYHYEIYSGDDQGSVTGWRVVRLGENGEIETLFDHTGPLSSFANAFPAPDFAHLAFVSEANAGDAVHIADLATNTLIGETLRPPQDHTGAYWRYWMGRWIDNRRFLYQDMDDVWLFDVSEASFTNLTGQLEQQAWLLSQTNSN